MKDWFQGCLDEFGFWLNLNLAVYIHYFIVCSKNCSLTHRRKVFGGAGT